MNVIVRLDFQLSYIEAADQHFRHNATEAPPLPAVICKLLFSS